MWDTPTHRGIPTLRPAGCSPGERGLGPSQGNMLEPQKFPASTCACDKTGSVCWITLIHAATWEMVPLLPPVQRRKLRQALLTCSHLSSAGDKARMGLRQVGPPHDGAPAAPPSRHRTFPESGLPTCPSAFKPKQHGLRAMFGPRPGDAEVTEASSWSGRSYRVLWGHWG